MKFSKGLVPLLIAVLSACGLLLNAEGTGANAQSAAYDENIKNHRLTENDPVSVRRTPPKRQSVPFKPSPMDDSPFQPVAASTNSQQQKPQILPVPSQTDARPVFARSLGETGEPEQDGRESLESFEELNTAAQTAGRVLPGLGWNSGYYNGGGYGGYGGGFGSGNIPCTTCNTIQQPAYNLNSCCTHGFSTCCYVGVQPLPTHHHKPHYPINTITPALYNKGGYNSYPTPKPWLGGGGGYTPRPLPYNQYGGLGGGLFGGGFGSSFKGGLGFGGKHGYNNGQKPGTCYRPSVGYGGGFGSGGVGYGGYNNYNSYARAAGQNNAGFYQTRSDSIDNIDVARVKRDAPVQSYGYSNYNNYNPYAVSGISSAYGTGGGHGGIIYPTTQKPYYCVRDYECPGNQKCCSGYCSTPSFVG